MLIEFLEDGESPDMGVCVKGERRNVDNDIGEVFIQRGIAKEVKQIKAAKADKEV